MNTKALVVSRDTVLKLVLLIGIAMAAPILFKNQFVTGPIVNATLIVGAALLGGRDALLIGLIPSTLALGVGIISPVLAPMIPFIIVGNAIMVLVFAHFSKVNFWLGAVVASVLKFGFLYGTSKVVIGLLVNNQVAPAVAQTMSWPQLVTALAGSVIAFGVLKAVNRRQSEPCRLP